MLRLLSIISVVLLASCAGDDYSKIEGERSDKLLASADMRVVKSLPAVQLPARFKNSRWLFKDNINTKNISFPSTIRKRDIKQFGEESDEGYNITSQPIITNNSIYLLDGNGELIALKKSDLSVKWRYKLPQGKFVETGIFGDSTTTKPFIGGNIVANRAGEVFVTTKRGRVFAVSAKGKLMWHKSIVSPIVTSPFLHKGLLAFSSSENKTYALYAKTGNVKWVHEALRQETRNANNVTFASYNNKIIVPYSSGELFALDDEDGSEIWSYTIGEDSFSSTSLMDYSDISTTPIYYRGNIYAASGAITVAVNAENGKLVWQKNISSTASMSIAGNYLFAVTDENVVAAINVSNGKIKWLAKLPVDGVYSRPVVAGGRIYVASTELRLHIINAVNGNNIKDLRLNAPIYGDISVADDTMYLWDNEAYLSTLK